MQPKTKRWLKWGCVIPLGLVAVLIIGVYISLRVADSPQRVLKHALGIPSLPPSITDLHMGSDVWTDEVRSFCFELAPQDFPALLAGRQFVLRDFGMTYEAKTMHIQPPITFIARLNYVWETAGVRCVIDASETKDRIIVLFSAD